MITTTAGLVVEITIAVVSLIAGGITTGVEVHKQNQVKAAVHEQTRAMNRNAIIAEKQMKGDRAYIHPFN